MKLIVGGCRGAHPVTDPAFMAYGGDTSAFLIEGAGGERILIDLGTGVRTLGARLRRQTAPPDNLLILLTHYHLDHTMGLPALPLLYDPRWRLTLAAPRHGPHTVGAVMPRLLHPPFWPLQMEHLAATIRFLNLPGPTSRTPRPWGRLQLRWCPVHHPDGCTAYRIEEQGRALVLATDVEWGLASPRERQALLSLCQDPYPASLLVMDGQFSATTYAEHQGWGHSTWEECVALARMAGVPRLLITHHGPDQTDTALDQRARAIRTAWRAATLIRAGRQYPV